MTMYRPPDPDLDRLRRLNDAFRPSAPVTRPATLAGRADALGDLLDAIHEPGQHAYVFGERGVGKTSVVSVLADMLAGADVLVGRVICDHTDDFSTVWRKVFDESIEQQLRRLGLVASVSEALATLERLSDRDRLSVGDVVTAARALVAAAPLVVVIDEYDRVDAAGVGALVGETLKALSDLVVPVTVVLVAVADSAHELLAAHPSIERVVAQVHLARLAPADLADIVRLGFEQTDLVVRSDAVAAISSLALRAPHYAHLLARHAGRTAVADGRGEVEMRDVLQAVAVVVDRAPASIGAVYDAGAPDAPRGRAAMVLLACALAHGGAEGWFTAHDALVTAECHDLELSLGVDDDDLAELATPARGEVLSRRSGDHALYRFANPLVPPYVVARSVASGALAPSVVIRAGCVRD